MRKLKRLGIRGKGGVKRKGKRFWEKENPIFSMCNRTSVPINNNLSLCDLFVECSLLNAQ